MKSLVYIISDIFSIITISLSFILKVPQIVQLFKSKSHVGLSLKALLLELSSYTTTMMYNYTHGHAILTYLEYPILIIQEYIIIALLMRYKNYEFKRFVGIFLGYSAISYAFASGILSKVILKYMVPFTTPVGGMSKVMQIIEIVRLKNADSVSALTWFLSSFTNATRIYTIWVDSQDPSLLVNFSVSTFLSGLVLAVTLYYQRKPSLKKDE